MMTRLARRLRYGQPITVVSGLPRSGTSLMMTMLEAGGMPVLIDGARPADAHNPRGYFEYERVKALERNDTAWLADARGKAVKIVSLLLTWLPDAHDYRVVFMDRELDEVLASQSRMLQAQAGGRLDPDVMRGTYERHLAQVSAFLARRSCFSVLHVDYRAVIEDAGTQAHRVSTFIGVPLQIDRMTACVDPALYRNRQPRAR